MFVRKVSSHPRNRLKRFTEQKKSKDDVVLVKKVPSYLQDGFKRLTKQKKSNNDNVVLMKKVLPHHRDRLARLTRQQGKTQPKIELDANILVELPIFDAYMRVDETQEKKERKLFLTKL